MADLFLFRRTLTELLRPRRLLVAVVLALIPAVFGIIWRSSASTGYRPEVVYSVIVTRMIFGYTLVILSVVYAIGCISQEIEQKTIVYLLTRPVPRWRILLARFAASLVVVLGTILASNILLALATVGFSGLARSSILRDLGILAVGTLAYGSLFLLLAALVKRPLLYGLLFAFGWESWVPNLPGNFQKISLMSYLRALAPHTLPESDTVDLGSFLTGAGPPVISHSLAWTVLLGVTGVGLALAVALFSGGEYAPREDAD